MELKSSFCVIRKRKIDKVKSQEFSQGSADSDDESQLDQVFDWMDPVAVKKTVIALEDRRSKRKRLKEEGIKHAEDGRFWEAIRKWESALSLSEFSHIHCQYRGTVANGGDEERAKDVKCRDRIRFGTNFDASEERVLDAHLLEMKAQALMELDEVFPAIQAAEAAVLSNPLWHVGWRTLGRAQIGFGDIDMAVKSFCKAIHLKPDEKEYWEEDLRWVMELKDKRSAMTEENDQASSSCGNCHATIFDSTETNSSLPQ